MATILLSAAGAAVGSGFGGTILGLSGAVIGRAVGATLGRVIDQRLMGAGSQAVETGRIERFRLSGASEGAPIPLLFGRNRVAGQVIWATRFQENVSTSSTGGRKGAAPKPKVTTTSYSYSVSFAMALCEGRISTVGRIWADGAEIDPTSLTLRVYDGSEVQGPDPKIEAVEGAGLAPAYRGVAYVVIEDLDLARFGNRVPQFTFEVIRAAQGPAADPLTDMRDAVRSVALMPGTGEYALATTPLHYDDGPGLATSANVNSPSGRTDLQTSLTALRGELPNVRSLSLIVSWFGDDLRCGSCTVQPKVEQKLRDATGMAWRAGGITRAGAAQIASIAGRPVYGGTPADASVVEAIRAIRDGGQEVMFYPFILMDQLGGNPLPDPYSGAASQPVLPWRGRITTAKAPGQPGTTDRTAAAAAEVAAFFGTAQPGHFQRSGTTISYSGPASWTYRRFILHYAHLCAAAGGVDSFCIGSEMRGLTWIRGPGDSFPAVVALRQLAADVRGILGPGVKLTYAADWSEYFGYHADGAVHFHLDPLWADPNIDFVGIDNYMPLSDWRDGDAHADASAGAIYNLEYLKANVAGGEGFDWYYDSAEGAAFQRRLPITDGAYGEPWVYRYKDIRNWWSNAHHDRPNGIRSATPTAWVPGSKPIRFTEYGCAATDRATNEPNKFIDPKSSESVLPKYSNGRRDDTVQIQYLRAFAEVWDSPQNNPVSPIYGAPMIDMSRAHVWAWDARPFPFFPNDLGLWSDGDNYGRGHWITGRSSNQTLAGVIAEICQRSGLTRFDVSRVYGVVRGFAPDGPGPARAALQPLMLAHGFEAVERDGTLHFQMRGERPPIALDPSMLVEGAKIDGAIETSRAPEAEMAGRVRLGFIEAESDFAIRQVEATFPDDASIGVSQSEFAMTLTPAEGRGIAERWLSEARVARDTARFVLPPSLMRLGAGDTVSLGGADYRIDRVEQSEASLVEAVRIGRSLYTKSDTAEERVLPRPYIAPVPVFPLFLDLPLLRGDEVPHAPHVAATANPWPGAVAVWSALDDNGYTPNTVLNAPATLGVTETPLAYAPSGLWDDGVPLRVRLSSGALSSATDLAVLSGANVMAIGDGSPDRWEIVQFATATLVAPKIWELTRRLRGQAGTDATAQASWPAGSYVVLMNGAPQQIALDLAARGLTRHYRIGNAAKGLDDPSVTHRVEAFAGIGLRPLSPVHLRATPQPGGALGITWTRRTRIDGDSWESFDVPLGEDREAYILRVSQGGDILRDMTLALPQWTYTLAQRAADLADGPVRLSVAQVSDRFGPGPFASLVLTA